MKTDKQIEQLAKKDCENDKNPRKSNFANRQTFIRGYNAAQSEMYSEKELLSAFNCMDRLVTFKDFLLTIKKER